MRRTDQQLHCAKQDDRDEHDIHQSSLEILEFAGALAPSPPQPTVQIERYQTTSTSRVMRSASRCLGIIRDRKDDAE